ncbi:MAG: transposase [bacterium]
MAFIRRIKKGKSEYLVKVENYREKGKVRQRVLKYLGKDIGGGKAEKRIYPSEIEVDFVKRYADGVVVDKIAKELKLLDCLGEYSKEILLLVYSHLIESNLSINRIEEWIETTYLDSLLGIEKISTKRLYEGLTYLSSIDFSVMEDKIYEVLKAKQNKTEKESVILDVTDTYFNDGNDIFSEKSRRGKDGKYKKLIQISLAINKTQGFPILHKIYEGNVSNIHILKDMIISLKMNGIKEFIVIDRGMSSRNNLEFLNELKVGIVAGLKRTKLLEEIVDKIDREEIFSLKNWIKLVNTNVYAKEYPYMGNRVIVVYNPSLEVVKREMAYEHQKKETGKERYAGYSFIYTNEEMSKEEVVRLYFEKEIIERSFKQMKGVLSLRPIRVWLKEHIIGHIRICYLAYCILSLFNYYIKGLKVSAPKALEELKNSYIVNIKTKDSTFQSYRVVLKNIHKTILDKLGVVYKF